MANNPTGQSSYGFLSNAALETEEQSGSVEGASLLGFDSKEVNDEKGSHRGATPLNFGIPSGISWSGGAMADGIISVAAKESRALIQASPGNVLEARGSNDTMIGLELGKRTYFQLPGGVGGGAARQEASQAPPKKPRMAGQAPRCQVEGCKADLMSANDAKDYHRRHKVCPIHSKAPRAMVLGKEQRFCQQCSRFHGLAEFDEGKRSCRRRLDGHNRRRRKPQPDALGLSARFLPAFQDSTRLGHLLADRSSFLPNVRSPALWNDVSALNYGHQKGPWIPRTAAYEDPSLFQGSMPAGAGMERQLFAGFHHPNDRSTLFSPQSPKGMIPVSTDVVGGPKTTHRYFQESADPLRCQSLSLASSSAGAGVVLSGLEAMPVGQGFARVSDSGCALSLQSTMQLLSSAQASVARSSMDMTSHSTMMMTDQNLHGSFIPIAQPLVGQQHQQFEWGHDDKLLSAASSLHNLSSVATTAYHHVGSNPVDKDHFEEPYTHGINGVGEGYDSLPLYSMVQSGDVRFAQDAKPTMDLMQVASSSHGRTTQPLASSESFDSEMSHFGDLQGLRAYGSSMFSSQQM